MKNYVDRTPTQTGRRKIIYEDGNSEYVTVEMADEPTKEGTPLNRATLLALQGFETRTTRINADGSVTETNADGDVLTTTVAADGSVVDTLVGADGSVVTLTARQNADGSITETLT